MKSDENLPLLIDQSNETNQEIFEYESLKVKNISKNRSLKGSLFPIQTDGLGLESSTYPITTYESSTYPITTYPNHNANQSSEWVSGNNTHPQIITYDNDTDSNIGEHGVRWRYDDYTTIDWIHDSIKDQVRLRAVRKLGGWSYYWDASQAWVVLTLVGLFCGSMASVMDLVIPVLESFRTMRFNVNSSNSLSMTDDLLLYGINPFECALYALIGLTYSLSAYFLVTIGPNHLKPTVFPNQFSESKSYDAAGSGIPEVKVILGGFVIRGFLGFKTLFLKFTSLLLTISSGLMVGVQGPLVHLSCAIGNVTTRIFTKYKGNDAKRREIMSAACAAGVSVAFGAPIGGVLFSLEEVSYYFPPKTMWRSFFCALVAAISVKIINPFGTGKLVMFQVSYNQDWHALEMIPFIFIGIAGGLYGGLFIKLIKWITKYQIKRRYIGSPLYQIIFISLLTSIISYPLALARMSNTRFVAELLQECKPLLSSIPPEPRSVLCRDDRSWLILLHLLLILLLKILLMILTFGSRIPGGLFVPSMVIGGCFGRIVGMIVQLISPDPSIIIPGVYAMVGAASTLSGVTRMTVSLSIIMFELTGGLQYVLPIMAGIMTSKWVADSLSKDSIYDQIIKENGFPYLNHKNLSLSKSGRVVDVMVEFDDLVILDMDEVYKIEDIKIKLDILIDKAELAGHDGGFPLVKNGNILIGYISFTDLNHIVSLIQENQGHTIGFQDLAQSINVTANQFIEKSESPATTSSPFFNFHYGQTSAPGIGTFDVSQWVDKAPLQVSYLTSCEMILELFSKLGVRSLVVVKDGGILCGLVHKKRVLEFLGKKARQE